MASIIRFSTLLVCFAWLIQSPQAEAKTALQVNAWARATIAGVNNAAVYGTFRNTGDRRVAIVSVSTPVAKSAMIHKTVVKGGMVSMAPMKSLPVPAGQTVECKPGQCHIMLMHMKHPLKPGDHFTLTLRLSNGASIDTDVKVGTIGQMTAP